MKVSVIIPAYNEAKFVGDAVRSVLTQTHSDFELVVVNDASTDRTAEVLAGFDDPRLRVVTHQHNRGLSAARNSGILATSGDPVAFLDGDDLFCPEKLAEHVGYLRSHPETGVTYNARFQLDHGRTTINGLWRAPATSELGQLVRVFPFAPSDMVVRRSWFSKVGLFDETLLDFSEDLDINCRLALAGCRFECVDKPLNQRRYHSARPLRVRQRLEAALAVLDRIFEDPRCPAEVASARDAARAAHYLAWSFYSFSQDDGECGREFLRSAVKLDPSHLRKGAVLRTLMRLCASDQSRDHKSDLKRILDQFPPELSALGDGWAELAAQGYLLRAVTAAMWKRSDLAKELFGQARDSGARSNAWLVGLLATHLLDIEELIGLEAAESAIREVEHSGKPWFRSTIRQMKACYFLNRSLGSYHKAMYRDVIGGAGKAIVNDPRCLTNRGLLSVSVRSAFRMLSPPVHAVTGRG